MSLCDRKIPERTERSGSRGLIVVRSIAQLAAAGLVVIAAAHLLMYLFGNASIGPTGIFLTVFVIAAALAISMPWIPFFGLDVVTAHWEVALTADLVIFGFIAGLVRNRSKS